MHERRESDKTDHKRGWQFSRTLSLDSLLAVSVAAVSVIFFGTTLDKRLSVMESRYDDLKATMERNEQGQKERALRIEETVKEQGRQIQQMLTAQPRR